MDKKILVEKIKKVILAFKNEGKTFTFIGLIPVYPNGVNTAYILMVSGTWLDELPQNQSISIITRKLFELLDRNVLKCINRVEIYDKKNDLHPLSDDLIFEDTIGFKIYYNDILSPKNLANYQI
jgi:hypothetical protein